MPWSTFNLLKIPAGIDRELDYLLLADIFATAWWGVDCSDFEAGDSVAVFGAGKVWPQKKDIDYAINKDIR